MVNLSNLLAVSEPSGVWITIIKAFEAVTNNYVLAIIFLTVVIGVVWGIVETFSKYGQQNMNKAQAAMQPELNKLKEKYASQPQVLQQKQNELQRKYMSKGYTAGCIIMMVIMILNLVIFFTLFAGLNAMSSYKISNNYDNLKYDYVNCLYVTDDYLGNYENETKLHMFEEYKNLGFRIVEDGDTKTVELIKLDDETVLNSIIYNTDFSIKDIVEDEETGEDKEVVVTTSNSKIVELINKMFPSNVENGVEIVIGKEIVKNEEGEDVEKDLYLSTAIQRVAMNLVTESYETNKDSFLWIENIWIADSPFDQSIVSFDTLVSQIGKDNIEEKEENIYNAFMPDLKERAGRVNGYYILPIICVLVAFGSMFITSLYNKYKNKMKNVQPPKQNKLMMILMPVILGVFALFYNSVFAIYMITRQFVAMVITPLQLMVVDAISNKKKKKEEDTVVVDYSRKF